MSAKTVDSEILSYLPLLGEGEKKSLLGIIEAFLKLKRPDHFVYIRKDSYQNALRILNQNQDDILLISLELTAMRLLGRSRFTT